MKHTKESLSVIVAESTSWAEVCRKLGIRAATGSQSHIKSRAISFGIDFSHFLGRASNRGTNHVGGPSKLTANQVLCVDRRRGLKEKANTLRRALDEIGKSRVCEGCGLGETWNCKPIVLEVHHKNGDFLDNRTENLQYLCPNCHSQT